MRSPGSKRNSITNPDPNSKTTQTLTHLHERAHTHTHTVTGIAQPSPSDLAPAKATLIPTLNPTLNV